MGPRFLKLCREFVAVHRHKFSARRAHIRLPDGWHEIGSGFYSEVWVHADFPDYVLKLSGPAGWGYSLPYTLVEAGKEGRTIRGDMWPVFAEYCRAYPHKHFPSILHFERVSRRMAWAVMPRYAPSDDSADYYGDQRFVRRIIEVLRGDSAPTQDERWLWPLIELSQHPYAAVDLHAGNWMLDESGTVIITDPFSATGAGTLKEKQNAD